MSNIKISAADIADFAIVQEIAKATFYETFSSSNSRQTMQDYLLASFNDEKVKAELSTIDSLFFIAFDEEAAIGYLKVNIGDSQTELQESDSLEIERIYVKAEYQGKSIGQLLYNKAIEIAQQQNKSSVWLGVWEENPKAIRFYEKNGFVPFSKHVFNMGNEAQTDIMMRKTIG